MKKSFSQIYKSERGIKYHVSFSQPIELLRTKTVDFEGRPVQVSEFVFDVPSMRYDGLKASDFALENQLAVGVQLSPAVCSLQKGEIIEQIENANSIKLVPDVA